LCSETKIPKVNYALSRCVNFYLHPAHGEVSRQIENVAARYLSNLPGQVGVVAFAGTLRPHYTTSQNISPKSTAPASQSLKSMGWSGATLPGNLTAQDQPVDLGEMFWLAVHYRLSHTAEISEHSEHEHSGMFRMLMFSCRLRLSPCSSF
jgi:hypothetical protein